LEFRRDGGAIRDLENLIGCSKSSMPRPRSHSMMSSS
jgi:hypothetical protein